MDNLNAGRNRLYLPDNLGLLSLSTAMALAGGVLTGALLAGSRNGQFQEISDQAVASQPAQVPSVETLLMSLYEPTLSWQATLRSGDAMIPGLESILARELAKNAAVSISIPPDDSMLRLLLISAGLGIIGVFCWYCYSTAGQENDYDHEGIPDLQPVPLDPVQREKPLSAEEKYLNILKEWEEQNYAVENRTIAADAMRYCVANGSTEATFEEFKICVTNPPVDFTMSSNIAGLPPLPPLLTSLVIKLFIPVAKWPDNLSHLTSLEISNCLPLWELPVGLSGLTSLTINNCRALREFPHDLPANLTFSGNQFEAPLRYTEMFFHIKSSYWANTALEIEEFKGYFLDRMWDTREAQSNPATFKEKQLNLIKQMDGDPELRQSCFDLALVGSADCHDNALAMFHQMQEKVLDIAMHKPGVPLDQLFQYGLALENKANLMQFIERYPELKRAINGGEGTEALLALQLLCHEKNIVLPIRVTTMRYQEAGWEQFRRSEGDQEASLDNIKNRISKLVDHDLPRNAQPSARFLAAQPFWQAHVNRLNPVISEHIAAIERTAMEKLEIEDENLFRGGAAFGDIDQNMREIGQNRVDAIANLYLAETVRLLSDRSLASR